MHLVAVLGYSSRRAGGLHPLCAVRVRHAEQVAQDGDAVLLSGWGRRGDVAEGELMRAAWHRPGVELLVDSTARNTRENALAVAAAARRLGVDNVLLVTSRWHAPRARALVRAALPGVPVAVSSPDGPRPLSLLARELACVAALPYQVARMRKSGGGGI
jgi:uncharacterized SAM-binding protein YcdF (DUF218 family)